ncbi:hypothetical protein PIIN_03263 [Serendipita indica DSM 11827]|uniref:Uncharacterized protein n=1 Tax=Serendipita indica (strain DSM 11827) TaxID=1109443 RepID=G4TDG2_SERID|nr:hypothetical protein PIIN_03263 [Serendipita indica DSM 11827]
MTFKSMFVTAVLVSLAALPASVRAQQSTVQCVYADWANNGDSQNPCQVWANLGSKCGTFNVAPLGAPNPTTGESASYGAPGGTTVPSNDCQCNRIAYSLMAACSWCQKDVWGDSWVTESAWATGCSNYGNATVATTVDTNGLNIPPYATQPLPGPFWDPTDAQAAQIRLGSSGTATSGGSGGNNGGTSGNGSHSGAPLSMSVGIAAGMAVLAPMAFLY